VRTTRRTLSSFASRRKSGGVMRNGALARFYAGINPGLHQIIRRIWI
jgi:hypothetical protein